MGSLGSSLKVIGMDSYSEEIHPCPHSILRNTIRWDWKGMRLGVFIPPKN